MSQHIVEIAVVVNVGSNFVQAQVLRTRSPVGRSSPTARGLDSKPLYGVIRSHRPLSISMRSRLCRIFATPRIQVAKPLPCPTPVLYFAQPVEPLPCTTPCIWPLFDLLLARRPETYTIRKDARCQVVPTALGHPIKLVLHCHPCRRRRCWRSSSSMRRWPPSPR